MDITKLDLNHIELFALGYSIAEQFFGIEPLKANPRKQKKIRKWITKTYVADNDLPKKVLNFIDASKSDAEVLEFMAACEKYIDEHGTWKRQLFEKSAADFSEEVKKAFIYLFEATGCCENVENQEDKIVLSFDECESYKRSLVLHTSVKNHIPEYDLIRFDDAQILKEQSGYKLICIAENFEEEISVTIGIFFDYATVETEIYRVDRAEFVLTPWNTLTSMACDILSKRDLGNKYFNQKELELMPLIKELCGLSPFSRILDETPPGFEILKQYIAKYKLSKILPLLEKIEYEYSNPNKRQRLLIILCNKLNEQVCEGLWRELYSLIIDTQTGYTDKLLLLDQEKLRKIRTQLTRNFHDFGYEGEYPTFRKKCAIKGIKLEESYNQSYFVGLEKNVEEIIHCIESVYNGQLQIEFLCGTALLKKNESITDIYSCCFNAKGRRLFKNVYMLEDDSSGTDIFEQLDQYSQIAVKRAECTKLSKSEYELLGYDGWDWMQFLLLQFFAGGLFATFMTLGMIILVSIITAVAEGIAAIPETIGMMPWWLCFLFCFFGFGVPMAIIDIKAKRK